MQLRGYQDGCVTEIWNALLVELLQAIVVCLPTGGGKTVIFSEVTKQAIAKGIPVMVLCNRKELIKQAKNKFNALGLYPVIIDPTYKNHKVSMCYIASIDTLRNRSLPDIGLLIVDEGHIRSFDPIVLEYLSRGTKVICFTATPERTGKKFLKEDTRLADLYPNYTGQMGDIYQKIIEPVTVKDLLELGYLVEPIYYLPETDIDLSDVRIKGGDYREDDLFKKFNKPKIYAGVVQNYIKLASGKKMICFCVNVEHSEKQAEEFRKNGIPAEHLDGESKDREGILDRFAKGTTLVLCNYGITTTGYDEPTVQGVILDRSTKIRSLYSQMIGRAARLCEEIGKENFIVIDHGSNFITHGWWEQEYEYSLDLKFISKTVGAGPIRYCEQCEAVLPMSTAKCPYCKIEQEHRERDIQLHEAKFVMLQKPENLKVNKPLHKMTIPELEAYRVAKEYKLGWLVHQLLPRGRNALQEYADLICPSKDKIYSTAWVNRQLVGVEDKRIENKRAIFDWMRKNQHVTQDFLKTYAEKKLKLTHSQEEINILIPKILTAFSELKLGILK